jgi:spore cortex formation protein SpoVR/YcgB (stage V sporulation)
MGKALKKVKMENIQEHGSMMKNTELVSNSMQMVTFLMESFGMEK